MASIQPMKSKADGKTVVSYKFKVCLGEKDGKQQWVTKTVKPIEGMTPKKMLDELQRQADTWEKELREGIAPVKRSTFGAVADEWFSIRINTAKKSRNTIAYYRNLLPRINERFGKQDIEKIKQKDIERFLNDLSAETTVSGERRYAPQTVHHFYRAINAIFGFAEQNDYVQRNVMKKVEAPKIPKVALVADEDFLSEAEARRFLDLLKDESLMWRCMMTLFISTGVRRGEACGLQWKDIDLSAGTITISRNVTYMKSTGVLIGTPKTETSHRTIPIPPSMVFLFMAWKNDQAEGMKLLPTAFVFSSETDVYKPMFPTSPTMWLSRFCKRHDLPKVSPHDLRHTCGSLMLASGASVKEVQNTLGHSDASTTLNFYVGTDAKALREASGKLANALGL